MPVGIFAATSCCFLTVLSFFLFFFQRASNVISREPYDLFAESETELDQTPSVAVSSSTSSTRNESSNEIDDILHNVMQQVDTEIRQCVDQGKPLTSILCSPPGRAWRHRQSSSAEHAGSAAGVGRQRPRQLPRGCSSRCPPPASGLRWLDTPHADVNDPEVQQSLQAVQPFDFQMGGRAPPVHIAGVDPDIDEEAELPDFPDMQ
ncbi:uncharacterized protein [Dermacentor andersoni]|uniref:uncharacterized protein isoform X3 n=1 Tax=Dermacentor andersoni TaxID=34620 RepID=UPI003B3AF9F0